MVAPSTLAAALDAAAAWEVLSRVLDPEVPVLSVVELGMVRAVAVHDDRVLVTLTPTYSGCPATEAIEQDIRHAKEHRQPVAVGGLRDDTIIDLEELHARPAPTSGECALGEWVSDACALGWASCCAVRAATTRHCRRAAA